MKVLKEADNVKSINETTSNGWKHIYYHDDLGGLKRGQWLDVREENGKIFAKWNFNDKWYDITAKIEELPYHHYHNAEKAKTFTFGGWRFWLDDEVEKFRNIEGKRISGDFEIPGMPHNQKDLDESKFIKENFSTITALADDCGKNTFKTSARDIRFTFENEDDKTKFVNKLLSSNIPHNELPFGVISINKSDTLDESKSIKESANTPLSTADPIAYAVKLLYEMNKFVLDVYDNENWLMNGVPDGEFQEATAEEAMKNYAEHDWLITDFEGNFSAEDFKDFLATFKSCTRSKSYDQAERARIIAEAEDLLKEYSDKIDEDADEDHAFSKEEVIAQLKQELPNLGDSGTIKYGFKSEAEAAEEFLSNHYTHVELDKVGNWFQIDYAELLKD